MLLAAVLVACVAPLAAQTLQDCSATDHFCTLSSNGTMLHTPADGATLTASGTPVPLVSFQVHYNSSLVREVVVDFEGYATREDTLDTCPLPPSILNDPRTSCTGKFELPPMGTAASTLVAVLPADIAQMSNRTTLCFHAVSVDGVDLPQRCVHIRPLGAAKLTSTQYSVDGVVFRPSSSVFYALVGNKEPEDPADRHRLRLDFKTDASAPPNPSDVVEIDLKQGPDGISAELPGQKWLGDTFFADGVWQRSLVFHPTVEHVGKSFPVSFQVITTADASLTSSAATALGGLSCGAVPGPCPSTVAPTIVQYTVRVDLFAVKFTNSSANKPLLEPETGLAVDPPQFSAGPAAQHIVAYVNCPMVPFGVAAYVSLGQLYRSAAAGRSIEFTLLDDEDGSLTAMGVSLTRTLAYADLSSVACGDTSSGCYSDTIFFHTAVSWTPALETMGQTRNVCIRADARTFLVDRCFAIEVRRCYYCTQTEDTLHSIAAKFDTDWLQLWSANFRGDAVLNPHEVNPNALAPGTVLRLGPIYNVRVPEELAHLAKEFQTTEEALRRANRDLPEDVGVVPAQALCVLPGICTVESESWML